LTPSWKQYLKIDEPEASADRQRAKAVEAADRSRRKPHGRDVFDLVLGLEEDFHQKVLVKDRIAKQSFSDDEDLEW
jgi:hypothetical protein